MKALILPAIGLLALTPLATAQTGTPATPATGAAAEKPATSEKKDLVEVASEAGNFKTFIAALQAAGLTDTFKTGGPYTIFAPTDEAFAKLPKATLDDLMKPENKAKLVDLLNYHVVSGKVMAATATTLDKATTLGKKDITLSAKDGTLTLNNTAKVVKADIPAANGVIHAIDTVIMPPAQ